MGGYDNINRVPRDYKCIEKYYVQSFYRSKILSSLIFLFVKFIKLENGRLKFLKLLHI